jgi:gluconolactonase
VIPIPEIVGNLAWGGPDFDQLFVAASRSVYRIPTLVRGAAPTGAGEQGAVAR